MVRILPCDKVAARQAITQWLSLTKVLSPYRISHFDLPRGVVATSAGLSIPSRNPMSGEKVDEAVSIDVLCGKRNSLSKSVPNQIMYLG